MIIETKRVFAVAALIAVVGVAGVELTRSPAHAESADYAASRINVAFQVVAAMPQFAEVRVPLAEKGDLEVPLGCIGIPADEAECMDVAYELPSTPSIVVETRFGTTSTLMRMDAMTIAGITDQQVPQSE